jgi:hypothetical protein
MTSMTVKDVINSVENVEQTVIPVRTDDRMIEVEGAEKIGTKGLYGLVIVKKKLYLICEIYRNRSRPDYRDYRSPRERGYSPPGRESGPPMKRMRGEWEDRGPRYGN